MTTVPYTETPLMQAGVQFGSVVSWPAMKNGDVGQVYTRYTWSDRSVQIEGAFGAGGNLAMEGSNDGTNFRVLNDPQGNAINVTTAKIVQVTEATVQVEPVVTAGDGTTSLTALLPACPGCWRLPSG